MTDVADRYVRAGALRLHVVSHTTASSALGDLLVIPGITSPAATWGFVARPLAELGWRVHVLDQRGRGLSDAPARGYALTDYAADAAWAIEQLALDQPTVLGHSLGARVVAALATFHPGLARRYVLADPPLTGPGRPPYPMPLGFYLDGIAQARAGMTLQQGRALEPTWDDDRVRDRIEWLGTCDPVAIAETYAHFHDEDFLALWDALAHPRLIYGGASPVVTADGARELQERNPTAVAAVVPGAGHMIPWADLGGFIAAFVASAG